ncbi:heavy metal-binding domain-containing protein [Streptomyces sp. A1547]|nr:heavy metal-binding domain-containing protein [Streptomyces sp. A1547]
MGQVPMVTTDSFPGFVVFEVHGLVWGWSTEDHSDAHPADRAANEISARAEARGANAILALRLVTFPKVTSLGVNIRTELEVVMYGTAVSVMRRTT